jgi:hypothetical protein
MNYLSKFLIFFVSIALGSLPQVASAESNNANGPSPSASASLDFSITIPGVLRFQVGTAGPGNVDVINFAPPAATLGDGSTTTQGTGGDLGNGVVTVDLFSNAGQVTITENNNSGSAGLDNGFGDYIPYTEIITTSGDATNFDAPALTDAGGSTSKPTPTSGNNKVTNRSTTWSYAYANTATYPAGTYGTQTNGGRVTYTAATP